MLYDACYDLYQSAFPEKSEAFKRNIFRQCFPQYLRLIRDGERPVSMLFSIPYPLVTPSGNCEARYLYAIATHPAYRGQGLAKRLLREEATQHPVFLRPMTPSLFDFYKGVGFSPLSPVRMQSGDAAPDGGVCRLLTPEEYLMHRDKIAPLPHCRPTLDFLSLYEQDGGAVQAEGAVALYRREGDRILFKEYWGEPVFAPRMTAFLGGAQFVLRQYDQNGTPFGMGAGLPFEAAFLAALD